MTTIDDGYLIEQVAKQCGVRASTLRRWSMRYGWPNPERTAAGYRMFSVQDIADIRRMAALVNQGHSPSAIIVGGLPQWPAQRGVPDFARLDAVRAPPRAASARYLRFIRAAVRNRAEGTLEALLIEAACLVHPLDRSGCAWLPALLGLAAWDLAERPLACADDVRAYLRAQVGAVGWAGLLEAANVNGWATP